MPFQEKSAWTMSAALLIGSILYTAAVFQTSSEIGRLAPPSLSLIGAYTVALIVVAIVGHIVAASSAPSEANTPPDERDRLISIRADAVSAYVLAVGIGLSLGGYLVREHGDFLFYGALASLIVSQASKYIAQIAFYRLPR